MSCRDILFDGANDQERCKCKAAVMRAYCEMLEKGCPERHALDVACNVYRFHHPEDTKLDRRLTVERWVYAEQFH